MKENSIEEQKIQQATNNILRGEDIESAAYILKKFMFDNVIFIGRRVNPVKIATRQVLNFIERYQACDYKTICLENNEMEEIVDKIQVEYNNLLKENEYMHKQLDKQQTTINKYAEENEQLKNAVAVANELEKRIKKKFIPKADIEAIVYECIPREKNIFTGEVEYRTNTNANSFLTQEILKLLESEE